MKSIALAIVLAGCAPTTTLPAGHPARPDAPTGRLAGPPAALRAGVAAPEQPAPPREPVPPVHGHHHH